jgi:8-oxo-dGTP pyrophosphatase MutT (NUDIX family)
LEIGAVIQGTGALIYCTKTNRYLFLLRAGSRYANTWGLPGGKIEEGELASTALLREIEEELGGTIQGYKLVPIETFTSTNENFTYSTFLITVEREFVPELNEEHLGYAWAPLDQYPKPLHPGVWRTLCLPEVVNKIEIAIRAQTTPVV